ncbi:GMC oxidoreductase [Phlyctema vagabunda]|uniref:GMC oxidoreductase n=1 Tax=Phlyctema vagabunda TaxID=108571 RepID=A0ABR4PT61_9HELO
MGAFQHSLLVAAPLLTLCLAAPFTVPFHGRVIGRDAALAASYDFVVVGGGPSGLIVANRLTEDADTTVLVIEAGELDQNEDFITIPGYAAGLQPQAAVGTKYDWNLTYAPQAELNGREVSIPIGKVVGGGTVLNRMSETFTPPSAELVAEWGIEFDPSAHGDSGYVQSSYPPWVYPSTHNFIRSMQELNITIPLDHANGEAVGAYWNTQCLTPDTKERSSGRDGYYDSAEARPNLHLLTSTHVTKLVVENSTGAVVFSGVEYISAVNGSTTATITADIEVILAAGAIHTPQLLQLSGIGGSSLLSSLGIQQVLDLPGVGENFQDHQRVAVVYSAELALSAANFTGNATANAEALAEYKAQRTGPYTTGGSNFLAFLPLTTISNKSAEISATAAAQDAASFLPADTDASVVAGYEAQHKILERGLTASNIGLMEYIYSDAVVLPGLQHPFSRGHVRISSTDALAAPVVTNGWLSNPLDLSLMLEGIKFARTIMQTAAQQELNPAELVPGAAVQSDADLEAFVKDNLDTLYHPAGTAVMMKQEEGGVVDTSLKVYGTANLRIVDTSIFPLLPATHIQSTVFAVAEKAADIIKKDNEIDLCA